MKYLAWYLIPSKNSINGTMLIIPSRVNIFIKGNLPTWWCSHYGEENFLKKKYLSYDSVTSLLHIYMQMTKAPIWKDACIQVFTVAIFRVSKTWKQPKCPSTDDWIVNCEIMCVCVCVRVCIHTHISSHKKEWNNSICSNMSTSRDYHTQWRKSGSENQI